MSFAINRAVPVRATRKSHRCGGCQRTLPLGSPAIRHSGIGDGGAYSVVMHPDCSEAEQTLNRRHAAVLNGDEWLALDEVAEYDDVPWLLAAYPSVAARMGLKEKIDA